MEDTGLIKTKKCTGCGRELPVTEFYRKSNTHDGLQYRCKECQREALRQKNKRESGGGMLRGTENVHGKAAHGRAGEARVQGRIGIRQENKY